MTKLGMAFKGFLNVFISCNRKSSILKLSITYGYWFSSLFLFHFYHRLQFQLFIILIFQFSSADGTFNLIFSIFLWLSDCLCDLLTKNDVIEELDLGDNKLGTNVLHPIGMSEKIVHYYWFNFLFPPYLSLFAYFRNSPSLLPQPPRCNTLHYTTLHYTTLHYTTLHYTTLHYTTLHYTTPHHTHPLPFIK